jgi:hypothetical protein
LSPPQRGALLALLRAKAVGSPAKPGPTDVAI